MTNYRVKANSVQYRYRDLSISRIRNNMKRVNLILFNIKATDYSDNINYNKVITVEEWNGSAYVEIFYGYIRIFEKKSPRYCHITAYSPAIKLFDRNWSSLQTYTNELSSTILSGIASGIMGVGTNTLASTVTIRFDYDNKLKSIAHLTNMINGEWWDGYIGGTDTINLASSRYDNTVSSTLTIGGNCLISKDNTDPEHIYNCITVLGRGDGVNQVSAYTPGFCRYYTSLSTAITDTATTIPITSTANFGAAGRQLAFVNNEQISYSGMNATNLLNATRAAFSSDAYAHGSGMRTWYAGTISSTYTLSNSAAGSSVDTYGIREYTYHDKRIPRNLTGDPAETCGQMAEILFDHYKQPIRNITVEKRDSYLGNLDVGKNIHLKDTATGLDANFKMQQYEIVDSFKNGRKLVMEFNNLRHNFVTNIDELKKDMNTSGIYGQGATNIYSVSNAENCDSTHPLHMRFFIPNEAVAINKVLLNFKLKDYRAYHTANANESAHTHGMPSVTVSGVTSAENSELSTVANSSADQD